MQQTRSYNSILSIFQLRQCFLNRPNPASFCLFLIFSQDNYSTKLTINDKSIDGVFGTQTWDGRMVGAEESAELWRHQCFLYEICYIEYDLFEAWNVSASYDPWQDMNLLLQSFANFLVAFCPTSFSLILPFWPSLFVRELQRIQNMGLKSSFQSPGTERVL